MRRPTSSKPGISFGKEWHILGPFQIGTRGMKWGSDPLEQFGGFHALNIDSESTFASSLTPNGKTSWSHLTGDTSTTQTSAELALQIDFGNVDWSSLQAIYGWSALQYQAWVRGHVFISGECGQAYELYTDNAVEVLVDQDYYFGGDLFTFRRAPIVLHLTPGQHQIDLRLVRDVRAMGGLGEPKIEVTLKLQETASPLVLVQNSVLVSDVVGTKFASRYGSLAARNTGLSEVRILAVQSNDLDVSLLSKQAIMVHPGQTRPLCFEIHSKPIASGNAQVYVIYRTEEEDSKCSVLIHLEWRERPLQGIHKMTYLLPSGIVSFAMIRPPPRDSNTSPVDLDQPLPIVVNLHGAGVEGDAERLSHSLDAVGNLSAWTIFPSGVTSWCGDDWHNWGWSDVESALAAIPAWIERTVWQGPGADADKLLLIGHSNGGQGVWYGLLHQPDRMLAAAPISGYASIQKYVSYNLWRETDPRRTAVAQAALNSFRHELLLDNAKGVPVLVQHGDADDNVPVFNARRMVELGNQSGSRFGYSELPDKGHWFDGVMTTTKLRDFYTNHLASPPIRMDLPDYFRFVVANPADTGSKFGYQVEHLSDHGQLGYLEITSAIDNVHIVTSNVVAFSGKTAVVKHRKVWVDGNVIPLATAVTERLHFTLSRNMTWTASPDAISFERTNNQLGGMDMILRTRGPFNIRYHDSQSYGIALQTARNMFQYFAADSQIGGRFEENDSKEGNMISIGIGRNLSYGAEDQHPIRLDGESICVTDNEGLRRTYTAGARGLAATFLRPLDNDRLELVVWGSDLASLRLAARLVPMLTGVAKPDFVIATRESLWKGLDGTLALGFFDSHWQVSKSAFLS